MCNVCVLLCPSIVMCASIDATELEDGIDCIADLHNSQFTLCGCAWVRACVCVTIGACVVAQGKARACVCVGGAAVG